MDPEEKRKNLNLLAIFALIIIFFECGLPYDFGFFRANGPLYTPAEQGAVVPGIFTYKWDNNGMLYFSLTFIAYAALRGSITETNKKNNILKVKKKLD